MVPQGSAHPQTPRRRQIITTMASSPVAKDAPTFSLRAQAALLKAANRVFELDHTAESLEQMTNGISLAHIVHELDSDFDPSQLEVNPGTSKYLTNKRNMQLVYKGLFRFIRRHVPELNCQARKFDFHTVVEDPEPQGISQLLAVMISAAAMGPDNSKYVPRIQNELDRDSQAEIMQMIRAMQQDIAIFKSDAGGDDAIDAVMEARDVDLLVEEQNATLRRQLDSMKKKNSDYITRLEYLQQSHESLKFEKEKNDRELEVLRKATQDGANSAEAIKLLEAQIHDQMEIIARNEETIRSHDRVKAQLEGEVQKLNQRSREAVELRDQVTELKHKAEELEKKANTAERYKQKLESQQHLAREAQNLEYEKAELQEQLRLLIEGRDRDGRTRKAEDELTTMITQSEQHLWDERNQKNQLMKDLANLEEELTRLKTQRTHDEHIIRELQEQIQQGGNTATQYGGLAILPPVTSSLQDELNNASKESTHGSPLLELSRFKAENELLRRTLGSSGDAVLLKRDFDEQRRQRDRLQQNFNDMFEKHAIAQEQIAALVSGSTVEGSRAFKDLRTKLIKSDQELDDAKKHADKLQSRVADTDRELQQAKALLTAAKKGGIEAIDEVMNTDKLISHSLKAELDLLRDKYFSAVSEGDAQKTQLLEALLAKEKLRKELEHGNEQHVAVNTAPSDVTVTETIKKSGEKIEKLRERLKERKQQLEQSEQEKLELQKRLNIAQAGQSLAAQDTLVDQTLQNLQRENALMTTAWYGLTTRLQSNHVVVQRRHDAPRSWLNKQRQIINATPRK